MPRITLSVNREAFWEIRGNRISSPLALLKRDDGHRLAASPATRPPATGDPGPCRERAPGAGDGSGAQSSLWASWQLLHDPPILPKAVLADARSSFLAASSRFLA